MTRKIHARFKFRGARERRHERTSHVLWRFNATAQRTGYCMDTMLAFTAVHATELHEQVFSQCNP